MNDFEQILKRLSELESEVARLKSVSPSELTEAEKFERLPADATVGAAYISYRFGCSLRQVQRGEAGTNFIPRIKNKSVKALKREVDAAWRRYNERTREIVSVNRGRVKARPRGKQIFAEYLSNE